MTHEENEQLTRLLRKFRDEEQAMAEQLAKLPGNLPNPMRPRVSAADALLRWLESGEKMVVGP